jgi:hypothetical protein
MSASWGGTISPLLLYVSITPDEGVEKFYTTVFVKLVIFLQSVNRYFLLIDAGGVEKFYT